MKTVVNFILSVLSLLSPAPTAWAIYAGVTKQETFPMPWWVALIGSLAVIATSAAAALLVVDILKHNQGAEGDQEQKMNLPVWSAWAVLIGCIFAEILLSLLIVIIPGWLSFGVLAFPMMTLAGVFAVALRLALGERSKERVDLRAKHEQEVKEQIAKDEAKAERLRIEHEQELANRRTARRTANELKRSAMESAKKSEQVQPEIVAPVAQSVAPASKYPRECGLNGCTYEIKNAQSVGGHMKKIHPELCKPKPAVVWQVRQEQVKHDQGATS